MNDVPGALRTIREEQWDDHAGLFLMNPGAAPHADIASLRLHPIRASALHALGDLVNGNVARAERVLDTVLDHQWPVSRAPWAGTFKVTAEEHQPPSDAQPFVHYDPNWRQFVGCTLAVVLRELAADLSPGVVDRINVAIDRCVRSEPEGRIPEWYTNPGLMAAWLGASHGDREIAAREQRRAERIVQRFDRHGDVDEYNSPTYDGVDLMALGLWITYPPNAWFAEQGARLADAMCRRISHLYHPGLGAVAGPYTRAYGLDMQQYVSFLGMFLAAFGESDTLPSSLDSHTVHSHDLSFLPLIEHVAEAVRPFFTAVPVDERRRHDQSFTGTLASSLLEPDGTIGVERGRRHAASRDQYVPVVIHRRGANGVDSAGFFLSTHTSVDAELSVDGYATGFISNGSTARNQERIVHLAASTPPTLEGTTLSVGSITISFATPPTVSEATERSGRYPLRFEGNTAFEITR